MDHLKVICDHGGTFSDTGILLSASLESFALQAGYESNPLDLQPDSLPWTEHCWWKIILSATMKYGIKIQGKPTQLQKWMRKDTYFMHDFLDYYEENESVAFYQSLNRVRIYLKVVTRSDLQQANERQTHPLVFTLLDDPDVTFSNSSRQYRWPIQEKPSVQDLLNWIIALGEVYRVTAAQKIFLHQHCSSEWDEAVRLKATW